jgi:hypothetical protein
MEAPREGRASARPNISSGYEERQTMRKLLIGAAMLTALSSPAAAQDPVTGNTRYEICKGAELWCLSLAAGLTIATNGPLGEALVCMPLFVDTRQMHEVLMRYLAERPEPVEQYLAGAISDAWPGCPGLSEGGQ